MTVYTIIYNDYDKLKDPIWPSAGVRYIVYSNTPQKSGVWEWIKTDFPNGVRSQRKLKLLGHEQLMDDTVYIDASILLYCDIKNFLRYYPGQLILLEHRSRDCVYDEYEVCSARKLDDQKTMNDQITRYIDEDYPTDNGMVQTGVLIRRGVYLNRFYRAWWKEIKRGSLLDQLSLNYMADKLNIEYGIIPYAEFRKNFKLCLHDTR